MIGKTILRWLISIVAIIAIFIIILLTPLGLKLGLTLAKVILPGKISYEHASGIITGPIEITHFKYTENKESISIRKLKLTWNPLQLLRRKIVIHHFSADTVHITMQPGKTTSGFIIPSSVEIDKANINALSIGTVPNQFPVFIKSIQLTAHINSRKIMIRSTLEMTKPSTLKIFLNVSGNPNHYTIQARASSPLLSWHLNGSGDTKGLSLHLSKGETLGGRLSFNAVVHWAKRWQWNVTLNGNHLNFAELNTDWPEQINVKLSTQGIFQKKRPTFSLWSQITAPGANIHIKATQKDKLNLRWNVAIKQLSNLYRPFKGSLNSKGEWSPNAFSILVTGTNLQTPNIKLQSVALQGQGTERSHTLQGNMTVDSDTLNFKLHGGLIKKTWNGELEKLSITSTQYHNWQLTKPTHIKISHDRISMDNLCLRSGSASRFCLQGNWDTKAAWQFKADAQHFNPAMLTRYVTSKFTLSSPSSLRATISGKGKKIRSAKVDVLLQKGHLRYQLNGNYIKSPIQEGNINITLLQKTLTASAQFVFSKNNTMSLSATLPHFSTSKSLASQPLKGRMKVKFSDLTPFNKILKAIAKPSGTITANLSIGGTLKAPNINGRIRFIDGRIDVPRFGIVFTKIDTVISSFSANSLKYKIVAYSKNKPIRVEGETRATPQGIQTTATVKATNIMLINNAEYIVYASPDLKINILNHQINVTGIVDIPQALLQPHEFANVETLPNNEIVYTAGQPSTRQTTWKITAKVKVKLGKAVTVNTSGFEVAVTGQAMIMGQPEKTTIANGRIDIIKGKYSNFGTTLVISPGSYIQFINSPIDNPNFNIRAIKRIERTQSLTIQQFSVNDIIVGAELRGTYRHPKITFFSIPATLSQADIISYLVVGSSSSSVTKGDTGSLLKAASSVGGPGGGIGGAISEIKQGLGLSELGVESETLINAIGSPIEQQTAFVIGKRLTQNIYIRYSYGLGQGPFVPVNIFLVRYRFNDHWAIQSNSSSLGSGGDVLYNIETN